MVVPVLPEGAMPPALLRYAAFAATSEGGNPAGIVLHASELSVPEMQRIAAGVGYSETAFVTARNIAGDQRHLRIRFFSPGAEVPFCGHATIATAVALAEREGSGTFTFETPVGPIVIETRSDSGRIAASFTSIEPEVAPLGPGVADELLSLLGLAHSDRDVRYPLLSAFAGNWHPILVLRERATFDGFTFDPHAMRALMDVQGWRGTVSVLHALTLTVFEARNLFPVGNMTEDPATGSAAASLGGYLRATKSVALPSQVDVRQGAHVGRPSLLRVEIPAIGGIVVSGTAAEIT